MLQSKYLFSQPQGNKKKEKLYIKKNTYNIKIKITKIIQSNKNMHNLKEYKTNNYLTTLVITVIIWILK